MPRVDLCLLFRACEILLVPTCFDFVDENKSSAREGNAGKSYKQRFNPKIENKLLNGLEIAEMQQKWKRTQEMIFKWYTNRQTDCPPDGKCLPVSIEISDARKFSCQISKFEMRYRLRCKNGCYCALFSIQFNLEHSNARRRQKEVKGMDPNLHRQPCQQNL